MAIVDQATAHDHWGSPWPPAFWDCRSWRCCGGFAGTVILTGLVFLKWGKEWRAAFTRVCENWIDPKAPRGVFVLCSGRVKLSTSSADGRTLILRMSESGEVLGLPATVTGKPYELTDDVIEPTQATFVARDDFLHLARTRRGSAAPRAAACETYHSAVAEMRTIRLSHSAGEKLARFLLELCADHDKAKGEIRITAILTHEEIAQIIGASRETVTRLFRARFKTSD